MKNILIIFALCLINLFSFAQENISQTTSYKLNCKDSICNYIINIPILSSSSIRRISVQTIVTTTGFENSIGESKLVDLIIINGQLSIANNYTFSFINNVLNCQITVPLLAISQKGYIKITGLNSDGIIITQKNIDL